MCSGLVRCFQTFRPNRGKLNSRQEKERLELLLIRDKPKSFVGNDFRTFLSATFPFQTVLSSPFLFIISPKCSMSNKKPRKAIFSSSRSALSFETVVKGIARILFVLNLSLKCLSVGFLSRFFHSCILFLPRIGILYNPSKFSS